MNVLKCPLLRKCDFGLYDYMFDKYEGWACPSISLDVKRDIWTYFVLNSVNIKYCDDPCRKNVILAYMVANLINGNVETVPWFKYDMCKHFVLYLVKLKSWNVPCRENEILAYMLLSLRNKKVELVLWFKTWYVNILCFVFGKINVLEYSLSQKRDFSLYGKFYKWKVWMCPLIWDPI